nr:MAG TPA_asm: hypothetical protein [Caudoviricetes sp.]
MCIHSIFLYNMTYTTHERMCTGGGLCRSDRGG